MSETTTQAVSTEEVKPVVVPEPVSAVATAVASVVPDALKSDVEKIVKDVLKAAIKELLDELKKSPLAKLDKDGDGHLTPAELHEALRVTGSLAKTGAS